MFPAASAMLAGGGGVFTPLEPYRRPKPIKTGLFSFSSRPKAVPEPYRPVPGARPPRPIPTCRRRATRFHLKPACRGFIRLAGTPSHRLVSSKPCEDGSGAMACPLCNRRRSHRPRALVCKWRLHSPLLAPGHPNLHRSFR